MYSLIRPLLFRLSPETSHRLALHALRLAGPFLPRPSFSDSTSIKLWDLDFPNPVGLAAGFDKYAEAVPYWERLGFGFCEIGTFTKLPQEGNPKPRVWRYPEAKALINRFGFNNPGSEEVASRLKGLKASGAWPRHPVGINIGKSKLSDENAAIDDYLFSFELLADYADYLVLNVSSPNTPGLRKLQAKNKLKGLLGALRRASKRRKRKVPILVKLAPDLDDWSLLDSVAASLSAGAAGIVLTNTSLGREGLGEGKFPEGGLSGAPLQARADHCLKLVARHTKGRVPLIGVGGIMSVDDARRKLELGASLLQIYTGFIYEGPGFPGKISQALSSGAARAPQTR